MDALHKICKLKIKKYKEIFMIKINQKHSSTTNNLNSLH